ncbi:succinate dehydrogenase membrane anchor subunit, partial [Escherichia coli]|nr:succinate dehydrogenase membrane anchor subunit [Escherichia coli]
MVKHVSSFGRNGVHDFLLIRATAIIMTLYTIYLVSF